MASNNLEIESKFYIRNLDAIEAKLLSIGAVCTLPRSFEYNLRFDNHQKRLHRRHEVLRLRKSDDIRLTFKGPGELLGGAWSRTEIELIVNDFDQAQKLLESLGFRVAAIYEKYRAIYLLDNLIITLDELPFGKFVEIEADQPEKIRKLASDLGLKPEAAIPSSYQGLFEQVRATKNLPIKNLAFKEFQDLHLTASDLGVTPADDNG